MAKSPKKQKLAQETKKKQNIDISFSLRLNKSLKISILSFILLLTVLMPLYYVYYAQSVNKVISFPIDDPWIHLQFARNLAEYGSFSYFKNEQVTAGSTSPIYTIAAAAGFLITKNEYIISFALGILFFALAAFYFYRLSSIMFLKDNWLAIAAALLFVIDKRLNLIAVSGMETTMYVFLLVACFYYYRKRSAAGFAITLGLTIWVRPDAVVFIAAIVIDYLYFLYAKKHSPKLNEETKPFSRAELVKIGIISGSIAALYFIMNLALSGSIMPNTYGAKIAYYTADLRSRSDFMKFEVWGYFTESAYVLLIIPFIIGVSKTIADTSKLRYSNYIIPVFFIIGLIFVYWYKMPYAHRFGRYLIPVFPFYFLLFLYGSRLLFQYFAKFLGDNKIANGLNVILLFSTAVYFVLDYADHRQLYQANTHHIYVRNVVTANWIKDNTPEGSIIATHDIGAIAYYSGRKLVDIAGLINPEFTQKIHTKDFSLFVEEQMRNYNVTHIAFIKEWFQVVNQTPLLIAGENNEELFEVYRFDPQKTHVLSLEVNSNIRYAAMLMTQKQFQTVGNILNRSYLLDTNSSLTLFYRGYAKAATGDLNGAEFDLKKALQLYPDYRDATILLSTIYKNQNRIRESRELVTGYLETAPNDTTATAFLKTLKDTLK